MGLRKILIDEEPSLHKVCRPVEKFDGRLGSSSVKILRSPILETSFL